jgi:hypothetical protein
MTDHKRRWGNPEATCSCVREAPWDPVTERRHPETNTPSCPKHGYGIPMTMETSAAMIPIDTWLPRTREELLTEVAREYRHLHAGHSLADWEFIRRSSLEGVWIGVDDPDFYRESPEVADHAARVVTQTFRSCTHGQLLCEILRIQKGTYHGQICSHNLLADRGYYRGRAYRRGYRRWIPEGETVRARLRKAQSRTDLPVVVLRSHPSSPGALPSSMEGLVVHCNPAWPEATVDRVLHKLDPPCHAFWGGSSAGDREDHGGISAMVVYVTPGARARRVA